jgi:hypothetical protein
MLVNMKRFPTRAPRFCVAYQAPHAVAGDGTHAVAAEAPHAVARDGTHARNAPCGRRRWNPRSRQRRNPCGRRRPARAHVRHGRRPSSSTPRARPSANGSTRPHAGGEKKYKVSTRPPATLPLSPRVLKRIFLFRRLTQNSPCPASSRPFSESAVMAIMAFVGQNEKDLHSCSSFPCSISRVSTPTTP